VIIDKYILHVAGGGQVVSIMAGHEESFGGVSKALVGFP
jgi:hypothetical protein